MGLYNLLHGVNPAAQLLLGMLELSPNETGRFRDCFIREIDGEHRIVIYTRNGGGNRYDYRDQLNLMKRHPNYVRDYDDDFDSTYASIEFSVPVQFRKPVEDLFNDQDKRDPETKWKELFEAMKSKDESNPAVKKAMKVGEEIFGRINDVMKEK